jgi:putative glutamine amidotransferase
LYLGRNDYLRDLVENTEMNTRPEIGLLLDYEAEGSFSGRPHYALRTVYFDAIWRAGGKPVAIPYIEEAIDTYVTSCAGFIFPGGTYPFPERLYGRPALGGEKLHPRYAFETMLMRRVLETQTPVLGICAGMQVMAGERGATFYNNIAKETDTDFDHLNARPAEQTAHGVSIPTGTLLHRIIGSELIQVNTAHNESIKTVPDNVIVNAVADDGIIEGVELPDQPFCLGVQWHPEFFATPGDPNFGLFEALVAASSGRQV